ncbi:MAG TPA: glycosyltransferase [Vicinamibacterales bacterium]
MTRTVVHVSDSRQFGGTEQIILDLLAGADRSAWAPTLIHQDDTGARSLATGARAVDVPCLALQLRTGRQGIAQIPQLVSTLRALRPHVIHAHLTDPLSCKFALIAAAFARVPAVVATLQLFMDVTNVRGRRVQHRVVSATVDRYLAVSQYVASQLQERLHVPAHKVRVVHNAIAVERFDDRPDDGLRRELTGDARRSLVLTVARLDEQKGHRYLLEAAVAVPEAVFVLVGDGIERSALETQAHELGVASRIRFLGERHDIARLLASADVFVLPSLYEGLPVTVLEAMAAGTPIVATALGGTSEAVVNGATGILVPPANPAALSAAIRRVLLERDLAARFSAAGRARVATRFSRSAMISAVETVYDEVLGAARP